MSFDALDKWWLPHLLHLQGRVDREVELMIDQRNVPIFLLQSEKTGVATSTERDDLSDLFLIMRYESTDKSIDGCCPNICA